MLIHKFRPNTLNLTLSYLYFPLLYMSYSVRFGISLYKLFHEINAWSLIRTSRRITYERRFIKYIEVPTSLLKKIFHSLSFFHYHLNACDMCLPHRREQQERRLDRHQSSWCRRLGANHCWTKPEQILNYLLFKV